MIIAAPNTQSTRQLRYSWNEGKTWQKLEVSDVSIWVDNIIVEPKSTSQQFIIYGSYDNSTEDTNDDIGSDVSKDRGKDIMISIDFAGLHETKC